MRNSKEPARIAVIGSGFGGLAAAIRLQAAGNKVVIFEKRDQPGGRAYVYRDKGFIFDAGPTVITAPDCLRELFDCAGKKMEDYVEMMPVTPFYRLFWENGFSFDYSNDPASTFDQIQKKSPKDVDGYSKFLKYSKHVFDEGYTKLAHVPFLNWWSMIRVAPQLIKLSAHRSVFKTVARFIKDPQLRQAFSFHTLLVGGNPFKTSSIYTLIHYLERNWGVFFPRGGTGALVKALVRLFEEMGGELRLRSPVEEILTVKGQVSGIKTADGVWHCDVVVSNADVVHSYSHLLRNVTEAEPARKKALGHTQSMSLFLIYFGTNKQYPELAHHNILFGKSYRGLLSQIFSKAKKIPDDFSLYLHAPTRTDPGMAPEGCEAFYVLSPVPHLGNLDVDWEQEAPVYAERILSYIEKRYAPGLRQHIVTQKIFTPQHFKVELNAHLGSAFSSEPVLWQSAFFRTHNRDGHVAGMYFTGAGTHPGAGVPGVVNSAKATATLVLEDLKADLPIRDREPEALYDPLGSH